MLGSKKIILFFVCTMFKYSKSETKDDCEDGKSYWSEQGIHEEGTCVGCVGLATCPDQQGDRKRCEDSCGPKAKSSQLLPSPSLSVKVPSATPTLDTVASKRTPPQLHHTNNLASPTSTSYKAASSAPALYISTPQVQYVSSTMPVVNSSTEVRVHRKRHDEKKSNYKTWIIWVCTVLGVVVAGMVMVVVWWWYRRQRKKSTGVEAGSIELGDQIPFQETETAVDQQEETNRIDEKGKKPSQEAFSSLRVGGIQDTGERKTKSSLNLHEECW